MEGAWCKMNFFWKTFKRGAVQISFPILKQSQEKRREDLLLKYLLLINVLLHTGYFERQLYVT